MTIWMRPNTILLGCLFLWTIAADAQIGGGLQAGGGVDPLARTQSSPAAPVDPATAVTIEGRVVNALTGEPIRQANVTLMILPSGSREAMGPGQPPRYAAMSDAQGQFKLNNLQPGRYQLSADKTGFVRANVGAEFARDSGPLVGKAGQKIYDAEIKLTPQAIIAGKVLDENGDPVANAMIRVLRLAGYFRQTTGGGGGVTTNAIGEFLVGSLAPGRYILMTDYRAGRFGGPAAMAADQTGAESYVPTYYPNTTDEKAAGAIVVVAGQQVRGIDVWLQKGKVYRVRGEVIGQSLGDRGRVQVRLMPAGVQNAGMPPFMAPPAMGNRDGHFEFTSVQPGSYVLTAIAGSNNGPAQPVGSIPITVVNSDIEGVVLQGTASAPMTITGAVKAEDGENNTFRGTVNLQSSGGAALFSRESSGRVQSDGTFQIENVSLGKYILSFEPVPDGTFIKRISAGSADLLTHGLDLSQPQALPPVEIILGSKPGMVQGVVKEGGAAGEGAFVTLLPEPLQPMTQRWQRTATTNASGQFSIKDVAPGEYRLYAWRETFPLRIVEAEDLKPYDSYGVRLSIKEAELKQAELQPVPLP